MPGSSVDARAWAWYNSAKRDVEGTETMRKIMIVEDDPAIREELAPPAGE